MVHFYVLSSKNILMKLVGYQHGIRGWNNFAFI